MKHLYLRMRKFVVLLLAITLPYSSIFAQNTKPKVALVLSGGGAKGVAHIPTLQAMDSLGIVPDLIVGNSMGSIVGGLYAMGYSGDEIAQLTKNADWDTLMGGNLSLHNVSNEEKSEFNQYLISADIVDGMIKISPFILSDQNLRTFITSLTYPVHNISNFDSLPIPFRAIATDIVAGKEVILDSGSLALAMRASMSIPAVFSAVPYKNTLLIDGGVLNNFPVDVAKKLDADFIIGSDVGNGMLPKERLDNLQSLLFQSGMIASNIKNPKNRALCDILLSHGPNISYATSDFGQAANIYEQGKIALQKQLPQLIKIADALKKFKQRKRSLPVVSDTVILDTIIYKGISKNNLSLVQARSNLETKHPFTKNDIVKGINTAMGTALFGQVQYGFVEKKGKTGLFINATELSNHQIKGGVHYDNDLGAGLLVNYTGRNLIGTSSRSLVTVDLAKNPKIRLQHQNIFGKNKRWWMRTEVFANKYRQGLYTSGFRVEDVKYQFAHINTQFNRNLSPLKSYIGLGLAYDNAILKPTVPPELVSDETVNLEKYKFQTLYATAKFSYNDINKQYFATKGASLNIIYKRSLKNELNIDISGNNDADLDGTIANHHKLIITGTKRFAITPKMTAVTGVSGAFIFEDKIKGNTKSFIGNEIGIDYFIGGSTVLARSGSFTMTGLKEGEALASQFVKVDLGVQYELQQKLFITPHINTLVFGLDTFSEFLKNSTKPASDWSNAEKTGLIVSTGLTASYSSILGPINIDVSYVNGIEKFRFFIGVGYSFIGL